MNTNGAPKGTTRARPNYTSTLIIILLVVAIAVIFITRYNRAPEPMPSGNADSNAVKRIPPDSLAH